MKLTPILLSAVPTGAGSDPETWAAANSGKCALPRDLGQGADSIDVTHQAQNAAVSIRPYFWKPVPGHANGGMWVGVGTDATAGASPSTADPGSYNGCAHGRFQAWDSGGGVAVILVVESGVVANVVWACVDAVRRSVVTT